MNHIEGYKHINYGSKSGYISPLWWLLVIALYVLSGYSF